VTDGVTVMSLSGSLLQKIGVAKLHETYISSHLRVKLHKKKLCKTGPACSTTDFLLAFLSTHVWQK
jgi:hypothetical protein